MPREARVGLIQRSHQRTIANPNKKQQTRKVCKLGTNRVRQSFAKHSMPKQFYQNFYKLQMAMLDNKHNVIIFGPEASGKCEALERCIEQFSMSNKIALITSKGVLLSAAHCNENVDGYDIGGRSPLVLDAVPDQYDMIIIDGLCDNWKDVLEKYQGVRIIMTIRLDSFKKISEELKEHFRIIAKTSVFDVETRTKGISRIWLNNDAPKSKI